MTHPEDRLEHDEAIAAADALRDALTNLIRAVTANNRDRDEHDLELEVALAAANATLRNPRAARAATAALEGQRNHHERRIAVLNAEIRWHTNRLAELGGDPHRRREFSAQVTNAMSLLVQASRGLDLVDDDLAR